MPEIFPFDLADHTVATAVTQLLLRSANDTLHGNVAQCALRMSFYKRNGFIQRTLSHHGYGRQAKRRRTMLHGFSGLIVADDEQIEQDEIHALRVVRLARCLDALAVSFAKQHRFLFAEHLLKQLRVFFSAKIVVETVDQRRRNGCLLGAPAIGDAVSMSIALSPSYSD